MSSTPNALQPSLRDLILQQAMQRGQPPVGGEPASTFSPQQAAPPPSMPPPDVGTQAPGSPMPSGSPAQPPQPSLTQRVLGGLQGQPGGGTGGLVGRMGRGAIGGMLGPTQRPDIEAERMEQMRQGGAMGLQREREAYEQPEQAARIAEQQAQTTGQSLQQQIMQRRLDMMSKMGQTGELTDLNPDEKAVMDSAQQEAMLKGDETPILQAQERISQMRAVSGRLGPGTAVVDPDSQTGVSRQYMTRGGQEGPKQTGAFEPSLLSKMTTGQQLVPTAGGGMSSVPKTSTTTPMLPGQTPRGGGTAQPVMGPNDQPLQPRMPAQEQRARDTATVAINQLPFVRQEIVSLARKQELGPLKGRIMELGRSIGTTDPDYIKLREDTDAAVGAFSVIHFGARGNWQWLQDFKQNVDAGKLTLPDLTAGWSVLERWLKAYQNLGGQGQVDAGVSAPGVTNAR